MSAEKFNRRELFWRVGVAAGALSAHQLYKLSVLIVAFTGPLHEEESSKVIAAEAEAVAQETTMDPNTEPITARATRFRQAGATVTPPDVVGTRTAVVPTIPIPTPTIPVTEAEVSVPNPEIFKDLFDIDYEVLIRRVEEGGFLLDADNGALRAVHESGRNDSSLEMQALIEVLAHHAGDTETLEALMAYDRRYIDDATGLAPWYQNPDGTVGDETVVFNVMMTMAWVRLQRPEHEAEGLLILDGIKQHLINQDRDLPQAFHWPDSTNLINPAYGSTFFFEEFARYDPYWNEVIRNWMQLMNNITTQIVQDDIASYPNWVDMNGVPLDDDTAVELTGVPTSINYDITYVALQLAHGMIYSDNPDIQAHSAVHLAYLNNFFQRIIAGGEEYDINRLLDGYNLDGTVNNSEQRYSGTAWAAVAAVAALVSTDEEYRDYMLGQLPTLQTSYSFNHYMRTYTYLTLSGLMAQREQEQ